MRICGAPFPTGLYLGEQECDVVPVYYLTRYLMLLCPLSLHQSLFVLLSRVSFNPYYHSTNCVHQGASFKLISVKIDVLNKCVNILFVAETQISCMFKCLKIQHLAEYDDSKV